jgi:hypothetical protein
MAKKTKAKAKRKVMGRPMKYTLNWAIKEVEWMLEYIRGNEGCAILFLSEMCEIRDYSKVRWSEVNRKYSKVEQGEKEPDSLFKRRKARQEHFRDCLDRVETILHNRLMKGGLIKKFDAGMTKFVLVNHHGYKSEVVRNEDQKLGKDGEAVEQNEPQTIFIIPSNNRDE